MSERIAAGPAMRKLWRRLLVDDPFALPSQSPEWVDAMTAIGGWEDATVTVESAHGRNVILPLVRRRLGGRWSAHSSFAEAWGIGGVLAPGGPQQEDAVAALRLVAALPAVRTTIRPNPLLGSRWAAAARQASIGALPGRAHVLDLSGGRDVVWEQRVTRRGRQDVRRAERSGVVVRSDASGALVPVFHDLLVRSFARWAGRSGEPPWMARYRGLRRDPLEKFEKLAHHLGAMLRIYVAEFDGRPAATALVLMGGNAHYTRGALDPEVAGRSNAASLIQWRAICDAIDAGCRSYHMGETGATASLAMFKEKFGAVAHEYERYVSERLPVTAVDHAMRGLVKRIIRFREDA